MIPSFAEAPATANEHHREDAEPGRSHRQDAALALFERRLAEVGRRERERIGRRKLWLAHHWPDDYEERCLVLGRHHVCRRCAALYPLGFVLAFLFALGLLPWPTGVDPAAIWLLSVPATVAYCGEAVGLFAYRARLQVETTLVAAVAFGRALSYELTARWSTEFWGPIAVFGGIWFLATAIGHARTKVQAHTGTSASS